MKGNKEIVNRTLKNNMGGLYEDICSSAWKMISSLAGKKHEKWSDSQWIDAIEQEGFVFLRHQVLSRSHALCFATAPWSAEEAAAADARKPPALLMRREEDGKDWDDGQACRA